MGRGNQLNHNLRIREFSLPGDNNLAEVAMNIAGLFWKTSKCLEIIPMVCISLYLKGRRYPGGPSQDVAGEQTERQNTRSQTRQNWL